MEHQTDLQKNYHSDLDGVFFGDKAAKEVLPGMKFLVSGKEFKVTNVTWSWARHSYEHGGGSYRMVRLHIGYHYFPGMGSAPAWFYPGDNFEWLDVGICKCGKVEDSRYSPACSLECWHQQFSEPAAEAVA